MDPKVRNVIAIISGCVLGSIVNSAITNISGAIIAPPNGADVTTMEGLKSTIHLFEPKHFIMPFLAHALGTLIGALVAAKIAIGNRLNIALGIGVFFLVGGIAAVLMLPSPVWFNILDLVFAYIPMAFIGAKIRMKF